MPQAFVHCVPMPEEIEADAPMYFKQALDDADEEWSQHKKVIPLTDERPLRRAIPPNFAYFAVEWLGGGYAHHIEDERRLTRAFGVGVIDGMLGRDATGKGRRHGGGRRDNARAALFEHERRRVLDVLEAWKPCDWTLELD